MIHDKQTEWQRQLNFDVGQSAHSTHSSGSNGSHDQQHQLQDIFGRSTKRPISAPPTSDEVSEFVDRSSFQFSVVVKSPFIFMLKIVHQGK